MLQADNVQDDDGETLGLGMATMRPAVKGWQRRGSGRGDGDGAALGEGLATVRLWERGWRRCDARAEDDGDDFPIHGELSVGSAGCPLLFRFNRPCYWTTPTCERGRVLGLSCSVG